MANGWEAEVRFSCWARDRSIRRLHGALCSVTSRIRTRSSEGVEKRGEDFLAGIDDFSASLRCSVAPRSTGEGAKKGFARLMAIVKDRNLDFWLD